MDVRNLTESEAAAIFSALTSCDEQFLAAIARAAIVSSAQMHEDMALDDADALDCDGNDIKNSAKGFVSDMLRDFDIQFNKAVDNFAPKIVTQKVLRVKVHY